MQSPRIQDSPSEEAEEEYPSLYYHMESIYKNYEKKERTIYKFISLYIQNRDYFEYLMRKENLTDLKIAFLFNNFINLHRAVERLRSEFEQILAISKGKDPVKTVERLKSVLDSEQGGLKLFEAIKGYMLANDQLHNDESIGRVLTRFSEELGKRKGLNLGYFKRDLFDPRIHTVLGLFYKEAIEKYGKKDAENVPEALESLDKLKNSVFLRSVEETNNYLKQYDRLCKPGDEFLKFFSFEGLDKRMYQNILKKYRWTEGLFSTKIKAFNNLSNKLASYITLLKEADQAILAEFDIDKKVELQSKRAELYKDVLLQVEDLKKRYEALGGALQLNTILDVCREISTRIEDDPLGEKLSEEGEDLSKMFLERLNYFK
ncbi:MAG: hypothetical protein WAM28_08010 [Chlamydiales bacterium]